MFLLDTDIVTELRRPEQANQRVRAWAADVPAAHFFLSVITLLEIERSALATSWKDADHGAELLAWIDTELVPRFENRILPIDMAVVQRCARLHVPHPRPEREALIAATALVHGMTVVTRNAIGFGPIGVDIVNPWAPAEAAATGPRLSDRSLIRAAGPRR